MEHTHEVQIRHIPAGLAQARWFDIHEVTHAALGDFLFNPDPAAHYAGEVMEKYRQDDGRIVIVVNWYKASDNTISEHIWEGGIPSYRTPMYWWADPDRQSYDIYALSPEK